MLEVESTNGSKTHIYVQSVTFHTIFQEPQFQIA